MVNLDLSVFIRTVFQFLFERTPLIMLKLDPKTTALVLIDLQKGILARSLAPHSADDVIKRAHELADRFRLEGAPVVLVNVRFSKDFKDALRLPVDQPSVQPPGGFPSDFSHLADGLEKSGDILVTKKQWSAFYGTDLDIHLRRRGIQTIVLGGVATNMGVESTARQAWEHNYAVIVVEDVTSSASDELHNFAIGKIFPRFSRVMKSSDITLS